MKPEEKNWKIFAYAISIFFAGKQVVERFFRSACFFSSTYAKEEF